MADVQAEWGCTSLYNKKKNPRLEASPLQRYGLFLKGPYLTNTYKVGPKKQLYSGSLVQIYFLLYLVANTSQFVKLGDASPHKKGSFVNQLTGVDFWLFHLNFLTSYDHCHVGHLVHSLKFDISHLKNDAWN